MLSTLPLIVVFIMISIGEIVNLDSYLIRSGFLFASSVWWLWCGGVF